MQPTPSPTTDIVDVRQARPSDCVAIMMLYRTYFSEQALNYPPIVEYDCLRWMLDTINQSGSVVAIYKGKIVGSVGISMYSFNHNRAAQYIHNEWFSVHPKFRHLGIANKMIEACKTLCDIQSKNTGQNIPFIFSISSGIDKRIDRLVELSGFKYAGGTFAYRMNLDEEGSE